MGAFGLCAGEVIVGIELADHGVEVAYVGRNLREPGAESFGLVRQLGASLREARENVVDYGMPLSIKSNHCGATMG